MRSFFLFTAAAAIACAQQHEFKPAPERTLEERLLAGHGGNAAREAELKSMFEHAGCTGAALAEHPVKSVHEPNLVCTHPGSGPSAIIVGAHFDKVDAGMGVMDNWTGASLLPTLFQTLGATRHTFLFAAFSGEERGLLGSKALAAEIDLTKVKAMINMDTLGLTETKVWSSRADPALMQWLRATAAKMTTPLAAVDVDQVGSSDSESFREKGIPAITIHSVTPETFHILHSPDDTVTQLDPGAYYRTYRLLLGYLMVLDINLD